MFSSINSESSMLRPAARADKPILEIAAPRALNDLSVAGVADATVRPTIGRYPNRYNPKCLKYWTKAVEQYTPTADDNQANWISCIRLFLTLCKTAGVSAFDLSKATDTNDYIVRWLKRHRKEAVADINRTGIFSKVSIRSVKRSCVVQHTVNCGGGFWVENVATIRALDDPTVDRWLQEQPSPGFSISGSKLLHKALNAATTVEVNLNTGLHDTHGGTVSLKIWCPRLPQLGNSRSALAPYIEKSIWLPIVRSVPFNSIKNKLF